jgi:TonB family protein
MSGLIDSAVSAVVGRSDFAQVHHPHAPVAHYDAATVLRALQRTGDMSYPGQLSGETVVRTPIGSKGDLVALRLVNSSGSDELDRAAEQVVRQTAPFPPFPAELEVQTSSRKLTVNMRFEGSKDRVPGVGRTAIAGVMDSEGLSWKSK